MHELAITQSLLEKVLDQARKNKLSKVNKIHISLGSLSGFVDESIDLYWNEIRKNTLASGSQIIITRMLGQVRCISCSNVFESESLNEKCVSCEGNKLLVVGGDELVLSKIEGE